MIGKRAVEETGSRTSDSLSLNEQVSKSSLGVLVVRVLGTGLALGVEILLARNLGKEGYGQYAICISMMLVLATCCCFGLPPALQRLVPMERVKERPGSAAGVIRHTARVVLVAALVVAGLVCIGGDALVHELSLDSPGLYLAVALLIPLEAMNMHRQAALRSLKHPIKAMIPEQIIRYVVLGGSVMVLTLSLEKIEVKDALWALILTLVITWTTGQFWLRSTQKRCLGSSTTAFAAEGLWEIALPLAGISMMILFVMRIDPLLVGWLAGAEQAANYSSASRLAVLLTFGLVALNQAIAPFLAELDAKGDRAQMQVILRANAGRLAVFTLPLALLLFTCGEWVLLGFGEGFSDVSSTLKWLVVAQTLNALAGSVGVILEMTGNQGASMWTMFIAVVVKVVCSLTLVPRYGAEGAAIGTLLMLATQNTLQLILVKKRLGVDPSLLSLFWRHPAPFGEKGGGLSDVVDLSPLTSKKEPRT